MVNRVDNILNSEQIWQNFRNDVLGTNNAGESRRYERINPNLGCRPPRLDEVDQLESLQRTVRDRVRMNGYYHQKISRIAHRLVASTFYFEKLSHQQEPDGSFLCLGRPFTFLPALICAHRPTGKICCRFPKGSKELRALGAFLRNKQQPEFQPYFRIYEKHYEATGFSIPIPPSTIESMITHARFSVDAPKIHISDKMGPVYIFLCLLEEGTERTEAAMPISGFPRGLAIEEALQRPGMTTSNELGRQKLTPKS